MRFGLLMVFVFAAGCGGDLSSGLGSGGSGGDGVGGTAASAGDSGNGGMVGTGGSAGVGGNTGGTAGAGGSGSGGSAGSGGSGGLPADRMNVVVGLGWQGLSVVSIDEGMTWCQTGLMVDGHDDLFRGGGYHDGLFVGAHAGRANRGAAIVSANGYEWEALHKTNFDDSLPDNPSGQWYGGVAYGNGTWLAAGGCGQIARSTDGRNWIQEPRFVGSCLHIRSVAFGNGYFVVGLDDNTWHRSTSGDTASWELWMSNVGSRVMFDSTGFHGDEDGTRKWRGRGLCMWKDGFGDNVGIMRSASEDCTNGVRVADTADSITTILYGTAPTADYAPAQLPSALRSCLGL